jgi:hypothetical protein
MARTIDSITTVALEAFVAEVSEIYNFVIEIRQMHSGMHDHG